MVARLEIGDVVTLKSGSPKMTVDRAAVTVAGSANGRWHCVWFEGAERRSGEFVREALDVATRKD